MNLRSEPFNRLSEGVTRLILGVLPIVMLGLLLLLIVPECSHRQQQNTPPQPAMAQPVVTNGPVMMKHCHSEHFLRFARPNPVTICVKDNLEVAITGVTPPPAWMAGRYPQIVDSLRMKDPWADLTDSL